MGQQVSRPRHRVGNKTVTILQKLGNGAFGVVYKVIDEDRSEVYALKDVLCLNYSDLCNAVGEAQTMNQISHKNVIAIMGAEIACDNQGLKHMLFLIEYCSGGNLNERLARPSTEYENITESGCVKQPQLLPTSTHTELFTAI